MSRGKRGQLSLVSGGQTPANAAAEPLGERPEKPAFAELCARSSFSFLEGASHPDEMVRRAHELGLSAIAVADRNGFYGSARAHTEAKKLEMPYIVGAELTLES